MKRCYLPLFLMSFMMFFAVIYTAAEVPSIGGYNVYYGHLHNHTAFSDGSGTPEQAYNYAKSIAHLDFFGLSDHAEMMDNAEWTTIKNAANAVNKDGEFAAFYGFEWSSIFHGHVTVINTEDYCMYTSSATDNFAELLTWVNARNGLAFFNHPGWSWWTFQEFNHFTDTPSDKFVGMELWNDVDGFGKYYYNDGYYSNDGNKGYFDEALIRGWKIGASGSDDNHVATWGTRTPWRMAVLANGLSRNEITDAIKARRFFSTLDMNLSLSLKVNGAQMGSVVSGGNLNLEILAKDENTEAFTKVVIIKNGIVAETINLNPWLTQVNITRTITGENNDYFYVKVTQADGDEAISSPVFIEGMTNMAPVVAITNPVSNADFYTGDQINIVASASDPDGTVNKVEFYAGVLKVGEDFSSPYECYWTPAFAGNYQLTAIATDNLGSFTVSDAVTIIVSDVQPPVNNTVERRVSQGCDDAEQYTKGTVILTDPVLNIVYESKVTGNQTIGLRFTGLTVPQGATITNAYIEFTAASNSSGSSTLTIKGEATDNAVTFSTKSKNLSSRKKTSASAVWTPDQWLTGSVVKSVDIKAVVQEVVNRSGWKSGNAIAILITGTGTRTAQSYEGLPSGAPLIHIEYSLAKSGIIAEKTDTNSEKTPILEKKILIYPNPVYDILNVKTDGITEVENIHVFSVTGILVKEMKINQNYGEIQINCGSLTPGTYLLKLNSAEGSYVTRFVKQ